MGVFVPPFGVGSRKAAQFLKPESLDWSSGSGLAHGPVKALGLRVAVSLDFLSLSIAVLCGDWMTARLYPSTSLRRLVPKISQRKENVVHKFERKEKKLTACLGDKSILKRYP